MLVVGGSSSLAPDLITLVKKFGIEIELTLTSLITSPKLDSGNHRTFQLDLENPQSCSEFIKNLPRERYDFIVVLAGVTSGVPIEEAKYSDILRVFQINVIGLLSIFSSLGKSLKTSGRICVLGSVAAEGNSFDVAYASSKAALRGMTQAMSKKLASTQRIYLLEPTTIEDSRMFNEMNEEIKNRHREKALGNLLKIEEVSEYLLQLMLDENNESGRFPLQPKGLK